MKIAVLSGKGGAGKTFLSVNLAAVAKNSVYIDCDVEEPNGYLMIKPEEIRRETVNVKIPKINKEKCDGCRICVDFCKFNALVLIKDKPMLFEEICHSCGGCSLFCPQKAIEEIDREIGVISVGKSEDTKSITGILNIGETTGVPIISEINKKYINNDNTTIIDCPPGSNCTVMESIEKADYCIIVVEPTIFGLHNMKMIYELLKIFNKKFGIIINKSNDEDLLIEDFANKNNIKIIHKIPYSDEIGNINSQGKLISNISKEYEKEFKDILSKIYKELDYETSFNS